MADQCINVHVQVPSNITLQTIQIGGADCIGGCTLTCGGGGCTVPLGIDVIATFANSGTVGDITPTLTVGGGSPIAPTEGATITVPEGGFATATFAATGLVSGDNNVCIHY